MLSEHIVLGLHELAAITVVKAQTMINDTEQAAARRLQDDTSLFVHNSELQIVAATANLLQSLLHRS
ncbi:hypothetical protein D3C85_1919220 [compost metagenome]